MKFRLTDSMVAASRMHTHCKGLHSVVLREGRPTYRLYYADTNHKLWRNLPKDAERRSGNGYYFQYTMSVGVHSHRQDITMRPVKGSVTNVLFNRKLGGPLVSFSAYQYRSGLIEGSSPGFTYLGESFLHYTGTRVLLNDYKMRASELHTVFVLCSRDAAWIIDEGAPDPQYDPTCYSNSENLEDYDFSGLYQPMSREQAENILRRCNLLEE